MRLLTRLHFSLLLFLSAALSLTRTYAAETPRQIIARAALADDAQEQRKLITSLLGQGDPAIAELFAAWRADTLFRYQPTPESASIVIQLTGEKNAADTRAALRVDDGKPLLDSSGQPLRFDPSTATTLTAVEHDGRLRQAMKPVLDLQVLASPDTKLRIRAIEDIGRTQSLEKLPALEARLAIETDTAALRALREALALTRLKIKDTPTRLAALGELKELHTFSSEGLLKTFRAEITNDPAAPDLLRATDSALYAIDRHRSLVNFYGTLFRGISAGSILLVVALGLAITFGLMKVINMAHGEMIAVGAYTTYLVQNIFGPGIALSPFGQSFSIPGLNLSGSAFNTYFIFALPLSFLTAALVGIGLERSIIRFLYRRPLESLLATWGVSLVLQQLFRLTFGANNVQVSSPTWLSGTWTISDVDFGWNRVFVIGFAVLIVIGVWLALSKTPLGLLIRAVMQNRNMASCMGVRTDRVNMLTFGLGSGLAGLAGAFISLISNVGPSLGQNYIVDCFMTVVVGGVGNIAGTVVSSIGIGLFDQSLQQILLNPVLGKILVLVGIILFLQWRPAGIFVTRSRSLDD